MAQKEGKNNNLKKRIYSIIYESDSFAGKLFDVILVCAILLSIIVIFLDSVSFINERYGNLFFILEWIFTILFTIEYIGRIYVARKRLNYIKSFFGIIDLIAILPTYLAIFFPEAKVFLLFRIFRILRLFRIFKMTRYIQGADILITALKESKPKIVVFLFSVLCICVIFGGIMFVVEGPENGFTSIPLSIYWAIVTLTTVGFGDVVPKTVIGKFLSSVLMIVGYSIIAVPTGIISLEIVRASKKENKIFRICPDCLKASNDMEANYCKYCGERLLK